MRLLDLFRRSKPADVPADVPAGEAAGDVNSPLDTRGEGQVTLEGRTQPGGQGSPGTNQGKAEPGMPPSGERSSPATPHAPALEDMSVGSADPQSPELPAAAGTATSNAPEPGAGPHRAPTDLGGPGTVPDATRPSPDLTTSTGHDTGPELPEQETTGTAQRAPGELGSTPAGERIETDVDASAAGMVRETGRPAGSGDTHGVPVPSETPLLGTSEEHGAVQGARIPDPDGPE
jgi:hypothetical protein